MPGEATERSHHADSIHDRVGLGSTLGFDDTRTKPLSVSGQVAHPAALWSENHWRMRAWWMCESQTSATNAFTSSSTTPSVLVEGAPHHLRRDHGRALGHADDREVPIDSNLSGGQTATREVRDDRPQRATLVGRQLTGGRDHVIVDLERGPLRMMLPHHRITGTACA